MKYIKFADKLCEAMHRNRSGNIVEARRPGVAPVDTSGFANAISDLMRKFIRHPYNMQFSRAWADQALRAVTDRMTMERQEAEQYGEASTFDRRECLLDVADKIWRDNRDIFLTVRRNITDEEHEYQLRAAERHDQTDNLDFWIESSDYLSGMAAMDRCAVGLSLVRSIADPAGVRSIIAICTGFLDTWGDHYIPRDGGEEPQINPDFATTIECLLPLLTLLFTHTQT